MCPGRHLCLWVVPEPCTEVPLQISLPPLCLLCCFPFSPSPPPEPDLKKRIRVHLLNAHGLDEAGIDGGGIFREFLNELLKSGFNPNQGFFKTTNEGLLYPNPAAQMLVGDSFARHYYFLGRMLGKVTVSHRGGFSHGGWGGGGLCVCTAPPVSLRALVQNCWPGSDEP